MIDYLSATDSNLDEERVDPLGERFLLYGVLLVCKPHTKLL